MNHIALTGGNRVGKDTVAAYLVEHYGYKRYAFADVLHRIIEDLFEIVIDDGTKDEKQPTFDVDTPRSLMIKTASALNQTFPFYMGADKVHISPFARKLWLQLEREKPEKFVITDYRFAEEMPIVQLYDCTVIQVGSFRRMEPMCVLLNDGTKEDLYRHVDTLLAPC